ncbi:MAG: hypothetical protein HRT98_00015 [Mycoplasmatales bacterium]|nr:hypothetical protein [Mycoplasmatales bacterium]
MSFILFLKILLVLLFSTTTAGISFPLPAAKQGDCNHQLMHTINKHYSKERLIASRLMDSIMDSYEVIKRSSNFYKSTLNKSSLMKKNNLAIMNSLTNKKLINQGNVSVNVISSEMSEGSVDEKLLILQKWTNIKIHSTFNGTKIIEFMTSPDSTNGTIQFVIVTNTAGGIQRLHGRLIGLPDKLIKEHIKEILKPRPIEADNSKANKIILIVLMSLTTISIICLTWLKYLNKKG